MPVPAVTTEQMREVDRLAVEVYGIQLIQMMEHAGRALAIVARTMLGGDPRGRRVLVAAGRGNNGGGGIAAARHLANWGAAAGVLLEREDALTGVPHQQLRAAREAGAEIVSGPTALGAVRADAAHLILDALIGYSLRGAPRGWTAEMIPRINRSGIPVLALDVPSGLEATTGETFDPCVRASATLTLALPKRGLLTTQGRAAAGTLYLADIGLPPAIYRHIGLSVAPLFARQEIVALDAQGDIPPAGQ